MKLNVDDEIKYILLSPNRKYNGTVGKNLGRLRAQRDLTAEKLCARLREMGYDISAQEYSACERGDAEICVGLVMRLQQIYGCKWADLFADSSS